VCVCLSLLWVSTEKYFQEALFSLFSSPFFSLRVLGLWNEKEKKRKE